MVHLKAALVALTLLSLVACGGARPLPSGSADAAPRAVAVHFVTDRAREQTEPEVLLLGARRSSAVRYGVARLQDDLPDPEIADATALLRFPATPMALTRVNGELRPDPATAARHAQAAQAMQARIARDLQASGSREILLYIHGFNSNFAHSIETAGELWLATGRTALPLAYSWPAGNPGVFGYFTDRESGEFTIFHLKQTLRLLGAVPGLERINIIAHSRGTDVATTALRELVIEARAAGHDPRQSLKVDNLILAAPDLDFSVVRQRLIAERFGPAFGRITVYMNPDDGALGLAQVLMAGTRFGRLSYDQLGANERAIFEQIRNVHFINVSAVTGGSSHTYFRNNPEVLADMSQVVNTGAPPDDSARNLVHAEANFWKLLLPDAPELDLDRNDR